MNKSFQKLVLNFTNKYFSAEVSGMENIPEGPCLLVGNHNGIGVVNPEIWIFGSNYFVKNDNLAVLGLDIVFKIPGLSQFAKSYLKYIPNNFHSAKMALSSGKQVLVYPGGGWESCRPSKDRDLIDFKNRLGYIKLAREAGVPIVPIVSAGAHDGVYVWKRGGRIARALRLPQLFRIDTFPLGFSFPFIFLLGPLTPFIPLPRKVILEVLPPVHVDQFPNDREAGNIIEDLMQNTLTKNVRLLPRSG